MTPNFLAVARRDSLLSQLSSHEYIAKHLRERNKRHPGTGTWLTENAKFKAWMAADISTCLWCCGIRKCPTVSPQNNVWHMTDIAILLAGSGKTVLTYIFAPPILIHVRC